MRLGELLLQKGVLTPGQLQTALHEQQRCGGRLGTNLIELGYADVDTIALALSVQRQLPALRREHVGAIDPRVIGLFPDGMATKYKAVPIGYTMTKPPRVVVACVDPTTIPIDEMAFALGSRIETWIAPEALVQECLVRYFGVAPTPPRYVSLKMEAHDKASLSSLRLPTAVNPIAQAAPAPSVARPSVPAKSSKARVLSPPPPPPAAMVVTLEPPAPARTRTLEPPQPIAAPKLEPPQPIAAPKLEPPPAITAPVLEPPPPSPPVAAANGEPVRITGSLVRTLQPPPPATMLAPDPPPPPPPRGPIEFPAGSSVELPPEEDWDIPSEESAPPASLAPEEPRPLTLPPPEARPVTAPPEALRPVIGRAQASMLIEMATSKEQIGRALEDWLRSTFGCGLVLVIKGEMAMGWRGFFPDAEDHLIEAVAVPLDKPSMFSAAFETREPFRGAPPADGAKVQDRLWKLLHCAAPTESLVCPVVLGKRAVNLLYAHMEDGSALTDALVEEAKAMTSDAATAYARLIGRDRKKK